MEYLKPERISLKLHAQLDEAWVAERIADDPAILGLGKLFLHEHVRPRPCTGRFDLILQGPELLRQYEVGVQLGAIDEVHVVRTIERWGARSKRHPHYHHCAVIVAEEVTPRFSNIVSLFNQTIPLIVIQMQALRFDERVTLVFTTIISEVPNRMIEQDEEADPSHRDRRYWVNRGSKTSVELVDALLELIGELDPSLEPIYNRFFIGLVKDRRPVDFAVFRPRKEKVELEIKLPRSDETDNRLDAAEIETLQYRQWFGAYRLLLGWDELNEHGHLIRELIGAAYRYRGPT